MHYSIDPAALEALGSSLTKLGEEHRKRSKLAVKCC
jgi:hypothetical protein